MSQEQLFDEPIQNAPEEPYDVTLWRRTYYAAINKGWTFRQATAMYRRKYGIWPRYDWPLMPRRKIDWKRRVADVAKDTLTG